MDYPIRKFRISKVAKDQLTRLKGKTGLRQWNVLCRWAFARSLAEATPPSPAPLGEMSNVELDWKVFTGPWGNILWYLLKERVQQDGFPTDDATVTDQFKLHLHRGIRYLASDGLSSISDLHELPHRLQNRADMG